MRENRRRLDVDGPVHNTFIMSSPRNRNPVQWRCTTTRRGSARRGISVSPLGRKISRTNTHTQTITHARAIFSVHLTPRRPRFPEKFRCVLLLLFLCTIIIVVGADNDDLPWSCSHRNITSPENRLCKKHSLLRCRFSKTFLLECANFTNVSTRHDLHNISSVIANIILYRTGENCRWVCFAKIFSACWHLYAFYNHRRTSELPGC